MAPRVYLRIMNDLLITTIQTNLFWEDKQANLSMLEEKIGSIKKTELVVLPEMFSTGFSMQPKKLAETMDGDTIEWLKKVAAKNRVIITGSLIIAENGSFYNRLIWMLPNGEYGFYDKRHLFACGNEHLHYKAGNKRLIASVKGFKVNLQVCYDLRFPVWSRQQTKKNEEATDNQPEFDLLVYVANWPERRNHAWKSLLTARAIENQCYVVGVNRVGNDGNNINHSGDSMVINPLGEALYHCQDNEDIHTAILSAADLKTYREKFPFWKDADSFHISL
ncbi:amidohydrolase [soil metagenome]